jgi:DNA-binding transcriptional ArsR family regulator
MRTEQILSALSALAQDTRLALFRMLVQRGPDGLPAGVIAERLGVPPSSLSFHLQQLVHAGLITQRRQSRQIIYAPDVQAMRGLVGYLTENCCRDADAACGSTCDGDPESAPTRKRVAARR